MCESDAIAVGCPADVCRQTGAADESCAEGEWKSQEEGNRRPAHGVVVVAVCVSTFYCANISKTCFHYRLFCADLLLKSF